MAALLRCTSHCTLQQREGEKTRNISFSFRPELICDADAEREGGADGGGGQLGGGDDPVREAEALDAVAAAVVGRVLRVDSQSVSQSVSHYHTHTTCCA